MISHEKLDGIVTAQGFIPDPKATDSSSVGRTFGGNNPRFFAAVNSASGASGGAVTVFGVKILCEPVSHTIGEYRQWFMLPGSWPRVFIEKSCVDESAYRVMSIALRSY